MMMHRRGHGSSSRGNTNENSALNTTDGSSENVYDNDNKHAKKSVGATFSFAALIILIIIILAAGLVVGTCLLPLPLLLLSPESSFHHPQPSSLSLSSHSTTRKNSNVVTESKPMVVLNHDAHNDESNNTLLLLQQQQRGEKNGSTLSSSSSSVLPEHYMVFSTGCTTFQDWQSYMFFFHAMKVGQPGQVIRIASGCTPDEATELKRLHTERIQIMSPNFHLHLTPDFMGVKPGVRYKFFNKPYGLRHWMEHALGYPLSHQQHDDHIVILLDPDQMLLRPMTSDFTNSTVLWKPTKPTTTRPKLKVEHGSPFGQLYGYAAQWKTKVNVTHVAGFDSPIHNVTMQQARDFYPMGPPYLATAHDMYQIVTKWTDFVPRVHDDYPHLLAEMFAYSLAAAHVQLPHQLAQSFMVSDTSSTPQEGWKLVDNIPPRKVCHDAPRHELPHVIHYCHRYLLGKWFIGKYRLRSDFISCESPLLMEPPDDLALRYDYYIAPGEGKSSSSLSSTTEHIKSKFPAREAFMVCTMIRGLNEAAMYLKQHNCDANTVNLEHSYIFHDSIQED